MVIKAYDLNNNLLIEGNVDDNNVVYELNMDNETGLLQGRLNIFNASMSQKDYLNLLRGLNNKNIAYFSLENSASGTNYLVSGLFVKNFTLQINSGLLTIRTTLEVTSEALEEFNAFLQEHDII